jgi:hypothetical protein
MPQKANAAIPKGKREYITGQIGSYEPTRKGAYVWRVNPLISMQ